MIKASELRIGNTVLRNNERYNVTLQTFEDIGQSEYNDEDFNPIPLTEEWLVKFGFDKKHEAVVNEIALPGADTSFPHGAIRFMLGNYVAEIYVLENKFYYELGMSSGEISDEYFTKEILYVHQLQNLYFALTGEELIYT